MLFAMLNTTNESLLIFFILSCFYLFIRKKDLSLQRKSKIIITMETKKITHEEALRRWKHSLEVKREWERKVAERWANEDQQKIATV